MLTSRPLPLFNSLISTLLNRRGLPIRSRQREALALLRTSAKLDLLLVEDWFFPAVPTEACSGNKLKCA